MMKCSGSFLKSEVFVLWEHLSWSSKKRACVTFTKVSIEKKQNNTLSVMSENIAKMVKHYTDFCGTFSR